MFGSRRSMAMVAATVGVVMVLGGCGSSTDSGQSAPGTSRTPLPTSTAAATTSAGSENPGAATESTAATRAPVQQPATVAPEQRPAPVAPEQPATKAPVVLWNPCGIADADIAKQGLRPDSKQVLTGADNSGDLSCRWQSATGKSELTIVSTRQTVQDVKQTGRYVDFTPVSVAARTANQYRAAQDTNKIGCYVGVTVPTGLVIFVTRNLKPDAPQEPCAAARALGDGFTGYLH